MPVNKFTSGLSLVVLILIGATHLPNPSSALSATALQQGIPSLAPMLEAVTPAVVSIRTSSRLKLQGGFWPDEQLRRQWRRNSTERQALPGFRAETQPTRQGAGSGVIIDAEAGIIVTNHHVVADVDDIDVILQDGRTYRARLLGSDAATDIALLRIDATGLNALEFSDSSQAQVGDFVVAIGNPFGIGQTVTAGIISALGRAGLDNERYEDYIQTDAAINQGNSGGALVDMEGKLVGINTAIISGSGGGNDGIGFAVPADMVAAVATHLKRDGEVRRGLLGVQISDNNAELAEALDLGSSSGALVARVLPDSAAEEAGLEVYDVITAIDGRPVTRGRDLRNIVGLIRQGDQIALEILRDGESQVLTATIGVTVRVADTASTPSAVNNLFAGVELEPSQSGGVTTGVRVSGIDQQSRAARSGLRAGDFIVEINRQPVDSLASVNQRLAEADRLIALTVLRDGRPMVISVS